MSDKKKKLYVRIICWVLALLMILGGATLAISMLFANKVAAASIEYNPLDYNFSSTDGDTYIAVGLMYDSNVTVGFEIKAPYGFVIGSTTIHKDLRAFDGHYAVNDTVAAAVLDGNLSKSGMTYSQTGKPENTVIGGYHIEFAKPELTLYELVAAVDKILKDIGSKLYAIPTLNNGNIGVRVGSFSSKELADEELKKIEGSFSEYSYKVVEPSKTCTSVVNPRTDKILFEFEAGETGTNIGFSALRQNSDTIEHIQTPADRIYCGVMCFVPQYASGATGLKLINLLDIDSYVAGVVPYEISNSWHIEVLRTYALAARSYAIMNYNKRFSKYGFDLVPTASDQVYRGHGRLNDAVKKAVDSTAGMVVTYNGKVCTTVYSSSVGGHTASSSDVWGGKYDYLTGVATPWERYSVYNKAMWHTEVSGKDLCASLRKKGYTQLSGSIQSISYKTAEDGSGYVTSITFTDTNGNTATVNRADRVKSALSSYLNSSRFVVSDSLLEFEYENVLSIQVAPVNVAPINPSAEPEFIQVPLTGYITNDPISVSDMTVITESGAMEKPSEEGELYVMTSDGLESIKNGNVALAGKEDESWKFSVNIDTIKGSAEERKDSGPVTTTTYPIDETTYQVVTQNANIRITTTLQKVTETIQASADGNFIFAGKGWGHGVGLSQYGAKDLADAGAKAEDIIAVYLNGAKITPYSEVK